MYCRQHCSKCLLDKPVTVVGLGYSLYDALATSFHSRRLYNILNISGGLHIKKKRDDKKETDWTDKIDAVPKI
jgi:hypothetical protein